MAPPSDLSDEQIRTLAAEILSRDEFFRPGMAEEAWRAVLERILGFLDFLEALRISSPLIYWLILAGLSTAAIMTWQLRSNVIQQGTD